MVGGNANRDRNLTACQPPKNGYLAIFSKLVSKATENGKANRTLKNPLKTTEHNLTKKNDQQSLV